MPPVTASLRRVFVRDLLLDARIGVYAREKARTQRIRINLDLSVREDDPAAIGDRLARVLDYEPIVVGVRAIVAAGHVKLVETLAERIAALCLSDTRVRFAVVRVEKLEAFADVGAVGVEIERAAADAIEDAARGIGARSGNPRKSGTSVAERRRLVHSSGARRTGRVDLGEVSSE